MAQCHQRSEAPCEVLPIKTIEDVLSWTPPDCHFQVQKLNERIAVKGNHPRTLVCHDMKGGYLEDRWVHGAPEMEAFRFHHWYLIDVFVYFSHHLATIPPLAWINSAHRNGVPILGTFITEWDEGFATCEKLLTTHNSMFSVACKLVEITRFYGFDGWLLNIENKLKPEDVPKMVEFVGMLTKMMHILNPKCTVIWYDSVINTGELKWQNELNALNECFFDACDGFFVNYTWTEVHLKNTATRSGDRIQDVYVGVDVFGRNCYGGGGFNTKEALKVVRSHGLSVAIFAPGWLYECLGSDNFCENNHKFWSGLAEFCNIHGFVLSFATNFCQGFGEKLFHCGQEICTKPWYNMSLQQIQPIFDHHNLPSGCFMQICTNDAYTGGGSLKLFGTLNNNLQPIQFTLFFTSINLPRNAKCKISYTFKETLDNGIQIKLLLKLKSGNDKFTISLPQTEESANDASPYTIQNMDNDVAKVETDSNDGEPQSEVQKMNEEALGWVTRTCTLTSCSKSECIIEEVGVSVLSETPLEADKEFCILLGNLSMKDVDKLIDFSTHEIINRKALPDKNGFLLTIILSWRSSTNADFWSVSYVKKNGSENYIGTTTQTYFHINDLELKGKDLKLVKEKNYEVIFVIAGHFYGDRRKPCVKHSIAVNVPCE